MVDRVRIWDEAMSDIEPKRRKRGPKPRPASELRRHGVSCRLTDAELVRLDERRGKVSRGEWLRLAALSRPPRIVPEVNKEAWADLSRAAGNLNQIARAINEGRLPMKDAARASKAVIGVRDQLNAVRRLLIGMEDSDESES